jgi:ethanolamine ammonia-lyase small subunit
MMTDDNRLLDRFGAMTPSRVSLGANAGIARTSLVLDFQMSYAQARDTIHVPMDAAAIAARFAPHPALMVKSRADDRSIYLRRPDLGRRLSEASESVLPRVDCDVAFVIADGLSSRAIERHAVAVFQAVIERLSGWSVGPVVVAQQARVAIGDDIGACLGATFTVVLVGERPGLSVSDSMGVYITRSPQPGRMDSERNCISNIHGNGGLSHLEAAFKIVWLLNQARKLGFTGIELKDEMREELVDGGVATPISR